MGEERKGLGVVRGHEGGKEPDEYAARWQGWGDEDCAWNSHGDTRQEQITNWIRRGRAKYRCWGG